MVIDDDVVGRRLGRILYGLQRDCWPERAEWSALDNYDQRRWQDVAMAFLARMKLREQPYDEAADLALRARAGQQVRQRFDRVEWRAVIDCMMAMLQVLIAQMPDERDERRFGLSAVLNLAMGLCCNESNAEGWFDDERIAWLWTLASDLIQEVEPQKPGEEG